MRTKAGIILLGQGEGIMKTKARIILLGLVMAVAFCYATSVRADSAFDTGAGATASVDLNFQIVIPAFIYFQVGSVGTVDVIDFAPSVADIQSPGAITAGGGGDLGGGRVTVSVISNGGIVTIEESNDSLGLGLGNSSGEYISYAQIITTPTNANLPAPTLTNAGGNTSSPVAVDGITDIQTDWLYEYENPATPPAAGDYGAVIGTGGRVTYTASIP